MAKKKTKKTTAFYEAIPNAPTLPPLRFNNLAIPTLPYLDDQTRRQLREYASAFAHDLWHYSSRVLEAFASLRARVVYMISLLIVFSGMSAVGVNIALATMQQYSRDLNSPAVIMNEKNTGTTILDRNGVVLFQGYGAVQRHNIPLEEMPASLKQATLASEDPDFYSHPGFSWRSTARAIYKDARHSGKIQGGSTITQQLVKNTLLNPERSLTRKYKEVLLSMELERRYSKDQILQMYLNSIYYGQGAYGIESAAETYFHKPAKDLNLQESALLAGLPQSPSLFDPSIAPDVARERRNYVLERMRQVGYIDQNAAREAENAPVEAGTRQVFIRAPHFVFYVLDQLRREYGQDLIEHGGITVSTSLDYAKQQKGEEIVAAQVQKLAGHHATNGGLVAVDPKNGDILTMVGSADYNQPQFGNVNVTLAQFQPGSSFKPIAYITAFSKGWSGATRVDDKPIRMPQGNGTLYEPQNYDLKFRGPVLLRRALGNSINIPAIQVLAYAGIHDTITMAHKLGIQAPSLTEEGRYGLSLALGSGEVRPIDMAAVYATFANNGNPVTPKAINKVSDRFGDDITKPSKKKDAQAVDPRLAYMITNILSDNNARTEEFGPNSPLKLSRTAAAKTGTSNDFRDNFTIGYTPDLVTAVWVGNNDHSPMVNVDGITGAAPIWHEFMEFALVGIPARDFSIPSGVVFRKVCPGDGGLTDAANGTTEVFLAENQPTKRCGANAVTNVAGIQFKPQPSPPPAAPQPAPPTEPKPGPGAPEPGNPGGRPEE